LATTIVAIICSRSCRVSLWWGMGVSQIGIETDLMTRMAVEHRATARL
jgi:hypothetical protein